MMGLDYFPSPEWYGATVTSHSATKCRLREPPEWPSAAKKLSFLQWDKKQPDEDDDDNKDNVVPKACTSSFVPPKEKLVGWPPVKRWRKKGKWTSRFKRTVENACIACRGKTPYDRTVNKLKEF